MARYLFKCHDCRGNFVKHASMRQKTPTMSKCPTCGSSEIYQDYSGQQINVFKPYVDEHTTGEPVELTSFAQRDKFFDDNNVTLDTCRYVRKPKPKKPSDSLDVGEIIQQVKAGKAAKPVEAEVNASNTTFVSND